MKNKLSLGYSDTKKIKKNWSVIDPCSYFIAHFSDIFRIRASSISAHSWRLKDEFVFWIQKTVCDIFPVYLLGSSIPLTWNK